MPVKEQVREYLSAIRRRWRLATTARGLAVAGISALVLTILAVLMANAWRFSEGAVRGARAFLLLAVLFVIFIFLVRPLMERLSDSRLARYVEEKNPHLRDRLVTAVHLSEKSDAEGNTDLFHELLAKDALEQTASVPPTALIHPRRILRPLIWAGSALALILLMGFFGPGVFRYGTRVLWVGWAQAKVNPLYQLQVTPGDITVGRNSDQEITARPIGFLPDSVRIFVLDSANPGWESAAMLPEERGGSFRFLMMNVRQPIEYYAESNGVRSPHYKITVIDVPHVQRLELRYHYPAYSGLKDTVEASGNDIIALRGTEVTVVAHTDVPASGGRIMLDDGSALNLEKAGDRELQGKLSVSKDALYHIRLQDHLGREAKASDEYMIQALTDAPPTLKITRPGHDMQPSPIEEVVIGLQGQDDVRMGELQLHYSVNGGPEQSATVARGGQQKEMEGSHMLSLEDYHLAPGDLISFYGVARDAAGNTAKTDMFFLQVRPFERNYTQAQTAGGQGGGQENTFLSEREKQVISATWNAIRKQGQPKAELSGQAQVLSSVQRTLKQQAETMASRTTSRELGDVNEEFTALVDNLKKAAEAMEPAAGFLEKQKFQQALGPEQTALQHLLRAEAMYRDIQVAFGNSGGGGGGGGSASRDLAELFALELDTGKNQYETLQQMGENDNKASVDDAMKKLEELARRQEDLSRREQQPQKDSLRAQSRWEQEMLRRETEELAKKMEQLSREMNSSQMQQAANMLSQAARDMQQANQQGSQSGQQGSQQGSQQANQQGQGSSGGSAERARAEQRLRQAGGMISGQQDQWNQESVQRLAQMADQMARQQQKIADDARRQARNDLAGEQGRESQLGEQQTPGMQGQQGSQAGQQRNGSQAQGQGTRGESQLEVLQRMMDEKRSLLDQLGAMRQQLDSAAGGIANDQKKAAQQLRGASSFMQEQRMEDKLRQGAYLEQRGFWPMASANEDGLQADLEQLAQRIKDAQKSLGQKGPDDKLQAALNLAEHIRQGLESLDRQRNGTQPGAGNKPGQQQGSGRNQQEQSAQGQQGQGQQNGQQSQNGQQAQNGQQGQSGQQGQQGQQGQSGSQAQGGQSGQGGRGSQPGQGGDSTTSGNPSTTMPQPGQYSGGSGGGTFGGRMQSPNTGSRPMTPEEVRQMEQEYQQLSRQASGLRSLVGDDPDLGKLTGELIALMEKGKLAGISSGLIDRWKDLELLLNRRLDGNKADPVRLAGQERVPEKYRAILEEYYRSLSRSSR